MYAGALAVGEAALTWAAAVRGIALVHFVAFVSLSLQIRGLVGRAGITPAVDFLQHSARHVPRWTRFVHWPTVFWVSCTDEALLFVCGAGAAASLMAAVGGEWSWMCFPVMYGCFLSLVTVASEFLLFPWDCFLLECSFLSMFLSPVPLLTRSFRYDALPSPWVRLAFRFLLLRVMFGMGKLKFHGRFWTGRNRMFLKHYMIQQPVPTALAYYAYHYAPDAAFVVALLLMFLLEVLGPWMLFMPAPLSQLAALCTMALQVGIAATGNYGYFNYLTFAVAFAFAGDAGVLQGALAPSSAAEVLLLAVLSLHTFLAIFQMPFSSYTTRFWMYTDPRAPWTAPWLAPVHDLCGWLAPFQIAHSYGVFGVDSPPVERQDVKTVLILEGTSDGGIHWHQYHWRYFACDTHRRPPWIAPHHPRIDQQAFYEGRFLRACHSNLTNPFRWDLNWLNAAAASLKRGSRDVVALFHANPFTGAPHRIRLVSCEYRFSSPDELAESGAWYVVESRTVVAGDFGHEEELLSPAELPPLLVWWRKWAFDPHYVPDDPATVQERIAAIELYTGMFD